MVKGDSWYNEGMRVLLYSCKENAQSKISGINSGIGWKRDGFDICYYNNFIKKKSATVTSYYTLTFKLKFERKIHFLIISSDDFDDIYIAHCYPYTFTQLNKFVNKICTIAHRDRVRKTILCKTLANNKYVYFLS